MSEITMRESQPSKDRSGIPGLSQNDSVTSWSMNVARQEAPEIFDSPQNRKENLALEHFTALLVQDEDILSLSIVEPEISSDPQAIENFRYRLDRILTGLSHVVLSAKPANINTTDAIFEARLLDSSSDYSCKWLLPDSTPFMLEETLKDLAEIDGEYDDPSIQSCIAQKILAAIKAGTLEIPRFERQTSSTSKVIYFKELSL